MVAKIYKFPDIKSTPKSELTKAKEDLALMPNFDEAMAEQVQYVVDLILEESKKRIKNREDKYNDIWIFIEEE